MRIAAGILLLVVVGVAGFVAWSQANSGDVAPAPEQPGQQPPTSRTPSTTGSDATSDLQVELPSALPPGTTATHALVERVAAEGLADEPTACLEVIDHTSQVPVAGAAVRRVHNGLEIAFTDDRGRASVPVREPEQLAVVKDGYLLRLVPTRLGTTDAEPQQVRLVFDSYSPRLRFEFRGPDGGAVRAAFVRFRPAVLLQGQGPVPLVTMPAGDALLERAWTEHGMLAGRPVCADVAVELGTYAEGRVHRLDNRMEVRFVTAGDYQAEVATLSGFVARQTVRIESVAGGDAPLVRIDLAPGNYVSGTVTGGESSAPRAGATVSLEGGDPLGLLATTAADGGFRLGPLLPGTVTLHVRHGAFEPQAKGPLQPPVAEVRVHLQALPQSTLRGRVRVRPDLAPLTGATILWMPAGGAAVTATSAADGTFVLHATGTVPSRLAIQAPRHLTYAELVAPGAPFADYDVWPATTEVRLDKKLTALLEGIVVDANGMPLPTVAVRWTPARRSQPSGDLARRVLEGGVLDLPLVATTGPDGAFRLETHHFGPGRLSLAEAGAADGRGVAVEAVPGTTKNGLRLQR